MWPKALGIAALIGLGFFLALWFERHRMNMAPAPQDAPQVQLRAGETARVHINTRRRQVRYSVRVSSSQVKSGVIEEVRDATVVVKDNGKVEVSARRWGFCLDPGLALAVDQGPRAAGDLRVLYVRKWGANLGLYHKDHIRLYFAGSYDLSRLHIFNTSLWAGLNLQGEIIFGLRLGF